MWMVGCRSGTELNMSDSFNGRKLRPLIPRPTSTSPKRSINSAITTHPYTISCIHGTHLFALNHRLAIASEQSKRDFNEPPLVSTRWNPTPEQLQALEDMYRRGTRTPTAQQIQQIATQLRQFGKIEGKNVFYWFQNHKARERRRQSEPLSHEQRGHNEILDRKYSGLRRRGFEVEETKNWEPSSNCTTLSEESISIHRAAVAAESRTDGWIQFEERELQQRKNTVERHATWQKIELSHSPLPHLINTTSTTTPEAEAEAATTIHPKILNIQNRRIEEKIFINPEDENRGETQTLQLFPVRSDDHCSISVSEKDRKVPITTIDANFTTCQFFEFLPLKN